MVRRLRQTEDLTMFANAFTAVSHTALRTVAGTLGTVIFAGACLMGATAPAAAQEAPRVAYVTVSDLNLASPVDQSRLSMRINRAARLVCSNVGEDVRSRADEASCVSTARADAKSQTSINIASRD